MEEEIYTEDEFEEEEILGDDLDDQDVYGDEEDDPELFYDPAEEEMVSGSGSGSDSMGYQQNPNSLFLQQQSAGASTNYTGQEKSFGNSNRKTKVNNLF